MAPPERGAVAAHELRQRMHDDVGAIFDRPQQDRRSDGVVDDQRHAMLCATRASAFDVADIPGRIANAFAEHGARIVVDQLLDASG